MDKKTFNRLREIVYENSGISLRETKEAMVSARVSKRMRALAIASFQEYLRYLEHDADGNEITHFLDVIATNVTDFFRESEHFDFLKDCLRQWLANGKVKIRAWSAAASTGEEALSIAMTVLDTLGERPYDFKILATDISTRALACAQQGLYEKSHIEKIPAMMRSRFFRPVRTADSNGYQASDEIRRHIIYRRLNLAQPPFPMRGQLDIVFCRNVMIYFDTDTRSKLVDEIYRLLLPGGYLFTGHAESLSSLKTDFKCIRPTVYQKQ
jgi:chemotaxis protein methyltransferase CheR